MKRKIDTTDYRTLAWLIIAIAISLRGIWALVIPVIPISDSNAYDVFAWNIVAHGTYGWTPDQPASYWPVGTSAIYAFLYSLFGHTYWPIVVFNIAIGVATIALTMHLTRQLFNNRVAIITGLLIAIWPSQIMYVTVLASELPFTFFTLAALIVWLHDEHSIITRALLSGFLIAAAIYIRPLALLLPFVFAIICIARNEKLFNQLKLLLSTFAVITLLVFPWSARNTNLWGEFVLMSTNGPVVLWMGNNPNTDGTYTKLPEWTKSLNEVERANQLGKLAKDHITSEPIEFVTRSVFKVIKVHIRETIAVHWNTEGIKKIFGQSSILPLKIITQGYWVFIILTAIAGGFLLYKDMKPYTFIAHPVIIIWAYYASLNGIILAQDRYHFPSVPFIAILSSLLISHVLKKRFIRKNGDS